MSARPPDVARPRGTRLRRAIGRVAVAALVAVPLLGLLGAAPLEGPPVRPVAASQEVVLALGDSVPAGHACGCVPFPEAYGSLLSARTGARVRVDNRAVSGLDTAGLLAQLDTAPVAEAVRRADVVLVTIGANDFSDHHDDVVNGDCAQADPDCVGDELESMRDRLATILATMRALRPGRPASSILVTGYWNVFEDGDVARRAFGTAGLQRALRLTRRANVAIRSVSASAGARYVDLFRPFRRPDRDVTSLMAPDGDHPNAAGHRLIARALLAAGLPGTS